MNDWLRPRKKATKKQIEARVAEVRDAFASEWKPEVGTDEQRAFAERFAAEVAESYRERLREELEKKVGS